MSKEIDEAYLDAMGAYFNSIGAAGPGEGERVSSVEVTSSLVPGECKTCDLDEVVLGVDIEIRASEPFFEYEGPFNPDLHEFLRYASCWQFSMAGFTRFVTEQAKEQR